MKIANPAQLFSFVANDKNKFPLTAIEGSVARGFKVNETELFPWLMKFQQWLFDFNEAESKDESATAAGDLAFQHRVREFVIACFGEEIANDITERNHRFLEESLELVQSTGCTLSEAHQLVDYVFSRSIGEKHQEAGGVMVTLAALCSAANIDMTEAGETELKRVWGKIEVIRAKQAAKPKHSPLPIATAAGDGKEAIDIMLWAFTYIDAWDKKANVVTLFNGEKRTAEDLPNIFKQGNGK